MKTLITGISGFTGQYLCERLRQDGHDVHGIVREEVYVKNVQPYHMHICDLLDRDGFRSVIAKVQPDNVVHLAAIAFVGHNNLQEMYLTNILGTRTVLDGCLHQKKSFNNILIASSANVYGRQNIGILTESALIDPANDYGITKLAAENLARIFINKLPITIVRPFNYTGVNQSEAYLIPKIVKHIRNRADVIELGNLDVARDFSDVRAVVDAYARLLTAPDAIGGTFNMCSGSPATLREVVAMACEIAQHDIEIRVNPAYVRANEVPVLYGNKARLESVIGTVDVPILEDTLRWMIES